MDEDGQTRRTIPSRSAPAWKWQGLHTHGRRALVKGKRAGEAKALEGPSRDVSEDTPASKVAATNKNNTHGCQAASAWRTKGASARATLSQGAAGGQPCSANARMIKVLSATYSKNRRTPVSSASELPPLLIPRGPSGTIASENGAGLPAGAAPPGAGHASNLRKTVAVAQQSTLFAFHQDRAQTKCRRSCPGAVMMLRGTDKIPR